MNVDFSLDHIDPEEKLPNPEIHRFDDFARKLMESNNRAEVLSSSAFDDFEKEVWAIVEEVDPKVISFDVFDTYLLRNDKPEAVRYLEMSELALEKMQQAYPESRRLNQLQAVDLCETRIAGMRATYRTRPRIQGVGEGLIDEVFVMQRILLGLEPGAEKELLAAEIEYEAENLVENPLLKKLAIEFKKKGGKVILISDMYLGTSVIDLIIKRITKSRHYDALFSSADLVLSKRSGKIFGKVEKELGLDPQDFLHFGDAWLSDVEQARRAGWNATYFPVAAKELRRRESKLEDFIAMMDGKGIETRAWAKL